MYTNGHLKARLFLCFLLPAVLTVMRETEGDAFCSDRLRSLIKLYTFVLHHTSILTHRHHNGQRQNIAFRGTHGSPMLLCPGITKVMQNQTAQGKAKIAVVMQAHTGTELY